MNGTKLTGLWKNTSKAGNTYLAGNLGVARILILQNDHKEKDTDPDYNLWLVPRENGGGGKAEGKSENGKPDKDKNGMGKSAKGKGEDIPF
jgi:hypothetical protein